FTVDIIIPSIALLVNTVACDTARRLLASPPLHTRKPPPSGIIYREPLPGEVGTAYCPDALSKCFVAINKTDSNRVVGSIQHYIMQRESASSFRQFLRIPKEMGNERIGYIKNVKVTKNSRHRGVGTWMLSNFLMHLKGKHPEVGSVYLMV
ncbi:hypothetical protein FOZ62_030843, partial [Perkinsus olseni]